MKLKDIVFVILSGILIVQLNRIHASPTSQIGKNRLVDILSQADLAYSTKSPTGYPHFFTIDKDFISNCRQLITRKDNLLRMVKQRSFSELNECRDKISQELDLLNQIGNSTNMNTTDMTELTTKVNKLYDRTLKTTKNIAMHFMVLLVKEESNCAKEVVALFGKRRIYPKDGTTFIPDDTYALLKAKNNLLEELKDMIESGKFEQAREDADELKKLEILVMMFDKSILRPREQLDDFFDYDNYGRSSEISKLICTCP